MTKLCERCGKTVFKRPTHSLRAWALVRFCSRECRKNPPVTCATCETQFRVHGRRNAKWCSKKCQLAAPKVNYTSHAYRCRPNIRYHHSIGVAKKRGLAWDISFEDYKSLISQPCAYCENALGNVQNERGVGLDRVVNALGYSTANVLPCCGECNRTRSDRFTVEETRAAIQAVLTIRNKQPSFS